MNSPPNLTNPSDPKVERHYFAPIDRPERTIHVECGCVVALGMRGEEALLLDAVGSHRLEDGRLAVIMDVHDRERARARQPGRTSPIAAADAAGRLLEAIRGKGVSP